MKADRNLADEFADFYEESGSAYLRIKIFPLFWFDGIINEEEEAYLPDCLASTEFSYFTDLNRRNLDEKWNLACWRSLNGDPWDLT